ncbi:Holliday junction branch migration protein RuvA [Tichowtungia aerotolerans]|uniref:Holliday junction branch migration complex subunit RuvA n=1 Tax=Tichowtungia aerotolerans TaxID=2697043 RepID=A0A6P1MAX3_9BACT|nr:Holliday junction branch migration protein RuvA [Tichowtungia aerotolerans]QHI69248.1 Holliday junction branch migration protein RuvA [Tichowtungia aerotolerans]
MITFLDGILEEKQPGRVVVNVGGVGYEVAVPLSSFDRLPPEGEKARVLIYHHITDASQALFGFSSDEERRMFTLLLGVNGIGPKIAVSALSGLSVRELKTALVESDVKRISSISGIGKKTAERVIVELRDKFSAGETLEALSGADDEPGDSRLRDAALALVSLGYKQDDARKMIKKVAGDANASVEDLIRMALTGK